MESKKANRIEGTGFFFFLFIHSFIHSKKKKKTKKKNIHVFISIWNFSRLVHKTITTGLSVIKRFYPIDSMAYSKSSPASDALLIRPVFMGASITTSFEKENENDQLNLEILTARKSLRRDN